MGLIDISAGYAVRDPLVIRVGETFDHVFVARSPSDGTRIDLDSGSAFFRFATVPAGICCFRRRCRIRFAFNATTLSTKLQDTVRSGHSRRRFRSGDNIVPRRRLRSRRRRRGEPALHRRSRRGAF